MEAPRRQANPMSVSGYLEMGEETGSRYTYRSGKAYEMPPMTVVHALIASNVNRHLGNALERKGSGCHVFGSDLRVYIDACECFIYPDSSVVCGEVETSGRDGISITNPLVVFEILAEPTVLYSRELNFEKYCLLPSLREYVLVAQDIHTVVVHRRLDEDEWEVSFYRTVHDVVELKSLGIDLEMAAIYKNV